MPETNGNGNSNGENKSLFERIAEAPSIPKEAKGKIARLEYEFARAEYEQCMFSPYPFFSLFAIFFF